MGWKQSEYQLEVNTNMEKNIYINYIYINEVRYSNVVEAYTYKEALAIQKERKLKSKNRFEGRLQKSNRY